MVARIAGVNIPVQKHVRVALQAIYGIGNSRALEICKAANIDPGKKKLMNYQMLNWKICVVK